MVNITPFKHKHLKSLLELLASNDYKGISLITTKTLPKIGYLATLGDQPIACGFLRKVEPCYGQIDTLTSNKYFGSEIRHAGINLVVESLIMDARRLKMEGLICHTQDEGIIKRAHSMGFHMVNELIIAKPL